MFQFANLAPSQIFLRFGGYRIMGLANTADAITFSTNGNNEGLALGFQATTLMLPAQVRLGMSFKVLASHESCTVLDRIMAARQAGNISLLPEGVSGVIGGLGLLIPMQFNPNDSSLLNFAINTSAFAFKNRLDFGVPFDGSDDYFRTFNIEFTNEIQNLLGALKTSAGT